MKSRKKGKGKGPDKARSYVPEEALAILLADASQMFRHNIGEGIDELQRSTASSNPATSPSAPVRQSKKKFKKSNILVLGSPSTVPQQDRVGLSIDQIYRFVWSYRGAVTSAAGRLTHLLARAVAYRHGLDEEESLWIKKQAADYGKSLLSREVVEDWLGLAVTLHFNFNDLDNPKKLEVFGSHLSDIFQRLEELPIPTVEADSELRLALALMGSEKVRIKQVAPIADPSWEEVKQRKSYSHSEVAKIFNSSTRSVRRWVKEKVLNQSPSKRVLVDVKFQKFYRNVYSPGSG